MPADDPTEPLRRRTPALGLFVVGLGARALPWLARDAGLDFLIYDLEHGSLSQDAVCDGVLMCRAIGVVPIVRVRGPERDEIGPALDAGALGVIVPMVETAEQIAAAVELARYLPLGSRGASFGLGHDLFDITRSPAEVTAEENERVLVMPLVETLKGVEAIDEICAVPGVELVWAGSTDLSHSMGLTGRPDHPDVVAALDTISGAAAAAARTAARVVRDGQEARAWLGRGYRVLALSTDVRMLGRAMRADVEAARATP